MVPGQELVFQAVRVMETAHGHTVELRKGAGETRL